MSQPNPPYPTEGSQQYPPPGAPPMAYQPPTQDVGFGLAYADFVPTCLSQGGFLSMPQYERFDVLVARANDWLRQNPGVKVKTCESVESKVHHGQMVADTVTSLYYERGNASMWYNRSFRVWFTPKVANDPPEPDQIGYFNIIPACLKSGGVFSMPEFEPFNVTIDKVNQLFHQQPLPGKIINIETQDMKFHTWGENVDPESCVWRESGEASVFFLMVLRIFYAAGPPAMETVGVVDFVPAMIGQGGVFTPDSYEPLYNVAGRAMQWIQQQYDLKVTNVQSVEYKVPNTWGGGQVDTMRSLFREYGKGTTRYLRIIRVYHTKSFNQEPPSYHPFTLSYRTFMPAMLRAGGMMSMPDYEPQTQTLARAQAWIRHTGAKVVSVETVPVRMWGQQGGLANPEQTYTYNYGNRGEIIVMAMRVYFDGIYNDPPPEAMPPLPVMAQGSDQDCCVIL